MSYGGLNARQAATEHALAVNRDFISQPRLSKLDGERKIFSIGHFRVICNVKVRISISTSA